MVDEGMFGQTLQVAQSYIRLFVIFDSFLTVIGASEMLTNLGLCVSGSYTGGPAKVSVLASDLTGMLSGTAAANVATTGTLTIPMMKRTDFSPAFASAVESIASTGGMLMPPIMGAAAFLMADFTQTPYSTIMLAAVLPAPFYYGSLLFVVHPRAVRQGISGLPKSEIPNFLTVIKTRGHLLLPIIVFVYLLMSGSTPTYSAVLSIGVAIAASFLRRNTWMTPRKLLDALVLGAIATVAVGTACLVAGFIVGVVSMTGVAQVLTMYIDTLSGGYLFPALFITTFAAILLSCALPATAVYIVAAVTVAPVLVAMGADLLSAHFFVFYFGVLSNITPPIAIACFTAAGIAAEGSMKIALHSLRLALPAFILPFVLIYHPALLMINAQPLNVVEIAVIVAFGTACYVIAAEGVLVTRLGVLSRLTFGAVAVLCLVIQDNAIGLVACVLAVVLGGRSTSSHTEQRPWKRRSCRRPRARKRPRTPDLQSRQRPVSDAGANARFVAASPAPRRDMDGEPRRRGILFK